MQYSRPELTSRSSPVDAPSSVHTLYTPLARFTPYSHPGLDGAPSRRWRVELQQDGRGLIP
eukprot:scaffold4495_cov117-Isochrysis_galbana.AAC.1